MKNIDQPKEEKKDWVGVYLTPKQLKTQLNNLAFLADIAKKGKEKAIALRIEGKIGFHDKEKFIVAAKKEEREMIENEIDSISHRFVNLDGKSVEIIPVEEVKKIIKNRPE